MKASIRWLALVWMAAVLFAAVTHAAPAKKSTPATKSNPAVDAQMAEMMKLGAPGPAHEKLRAMEGRWKAVTKSWLAPGEPAVSEGTSENRMVLGGRFLEQQVKATMMGQPYEGLGLTGYDNKKGVYTFTWVDNMGTMTMTGEGSMDAAGQELTMKGSEDGPDGKPMDFRMVTRIVDPNRHVWSMYGTQDGKEQLMMEITYTRER
jgi:Protein of unknown function (DUF1579)